MKLSPSIHQAQKIKKLRATVKHMLVESRKNFFISLENDFEHNPKRLWSILKYKSKSRNIPNTISSAATTNIDQDTHSSRISADKPVDIANMFNN
jgi:ribosomal protein S17E